ncbi:hypothetical protein D1159_09665 [Pseudoflavonifractor sp. 524-17]|nr:hypothetical protein [Pseudoflavonifractor sp. 524-17]
MNPADPCGIISIASDVVIPHVLQDFAGHYQRPEIFAPLFAQYVQEKSESCQEKENGPYARRG